MYSLVILLSQVLGVRVGKKRTIVIPKVVADLLGIDEGSRLILEVKDGKIILTPLPDAITLSIRGPKVGRVSLRDLEVVSIEEQKKYLREA